jgi:hypothetical protein
MSAETERSAELDWIEDEMLKRGTDNQRERWLAGLLPEAELLSLARYELFLPFASFRRWVKLDAGDVRHERTCNGGVVAFTTHTPGHLTHDEWSVLKRLTTAVSLANNGYLAESKVTATLTLVEHVGRCNVCAAEVFGRAANIRIEWAGRPLSREYTLEGQS